MPPETPPRSPSPAAPPRPPSPIGIGARLPRRTRTKPRERWKLSNAQLDDEVDDEIEDADMGYERCLGRLGTSETSVRLHRSGDRLAISHPKAFQDV